MQLQIESFNGYDLQDANFAAYFPAGSVETGPEGVPQFVERTNYAPLFTSKQRKAKIVPIHIKMLGTIHSQLDTLKAQLDVYGSTLKTLLVSDTANGNKQWYVMATPIVFAKRDGQEVVINLFVPDPVWQSNTQNTDSWSITASGQTNDVTTAGNLEAYPIFEITPTAAKSNVANATKRNRRFVTIYNQTTRTFSTYPIEITGGGLDTAALIATTANKCQINNGAGITNNATTIDYDTVTGTIPVSGKGYVDTEQISWTGGGGAASGTLTGVTRGINGTTAATHADNAEIKVSKMDADGGDIHVFVDGAEVDYWLSGINGASTKIWANFNLQSKQEMTVEGSYTDSATAITLETTSGNRAAIAQIPSSGLLLWESEIVTYTAKSEGGLSLTLGGRGAKGSSAAAHADSTTMRFIEHDIWLVYGDTSLTDYTVDDTNKPIFNLSTSTNTSWDYDDFMTTNASATALPRVGRWAYSITNRGTFDDDEDDQVGVYHTVAASAADADNQVSAGLVSRTFAIMGMLINGGASDYSSILWDLYHPGGVTDIAADGNKYAQLDTIWTSNITATLDKSTDGNTWTAIRTEATGASNTITAWTQGSTSLSGTYYYLRFLMQCSGDMNFIMFWEANNVTLTLSSSGVPSVSLGSEQTPYLIDATLKNNTTGEYIVINYAIPVNDTLKIDTDAKTVTYVDEGIGAREAISFSSVRDEWLKLNNGANELLWTEIGAAGLTVVTKWRDRNS